MNISLLRVSTLALMLVASTPSLVLAQVTPAPAPGGAVAVEEDDGFDYGWLGLLGLLGLAGLARRRDRRDHDVHSTTTTRR